MYVTKRQIEIFNYLKNYISQNGYAPTFEEIAIQFNFKSKGTVYKHIRTLKKKGLVKHQWNRTRAIELEPTEKELTILPVLGLISGGKLLQMTEKVEQIQVPQTLIKSGGHFLVKVIDNSLSQEHILEDDIIIIQENEEAEDGQPVLVLIENDRSVLKRLYKRKNNIELRNLYQKSRRFLFEKDSVRVQGVLIGVLRRY